MVQVTQEIDEPFSLRGQPTAERPVVCLPGERWLQVVGMLRLVAKDTMSALVKPTQEIQEFSVDAVGYGMVPPSLRGQGPRNDSYCALPGERCLPGLRAERRAKDTTSAMVKRTQISTSRRLCRRHGMVPSPLLSAMATLTPEIEESGVDVVVTAWCRSCPMRAERDLQG